MRSFRSFLLRHSEPTEASLNRETSHVPQRPPPQSWRALYVAALLEKDRKRLAGRIADAERALVVRARELFHTSGDNLQEEQAIDDALYALHALQRCTGVDADARQYAESRFEVQSAQLSR